MREIETGQHNFTHNIIDNNHSTCYIIADNILAYFGLSTLRSRCIQLDLCFFFKVINYIITCTSILGLFLLHVPQCNFRSVHLLVVPYHRTNYVWVKVAFIQNLQEC
jgi:hypothetical protein